MLTTSFTSQESTKGGNSLGKSKSYNKYNELRPEGLF